MKLFTQLLDEGLKERGHQTKIWGPKLYLSNSKLPSILMKWLRYIDQYLIFPFTFKIKSKHIPDDTLFVLIDQALGIWVPLIQNKKHVIHCHDFIALKSAHGIIKQNPTGWTGKIYQKMIFRELSKANCFISISKNTQMELGRFMGKKPIVHEQIYNALNPMFVPGSFLKAREVIGKQVSVNLEAGYILHVGGNAFYKNRVGLIAIYTAWRKKSKSTLPLLLVGGVQQPSTNIKQKCKESPYSNDIHFLVNVADEIILKAYQGAILLVYPSLFEGFGWPVAEAMAAGCPVLTTDEAPMNEVGGTAAIYIKKCPNEDVLEVWANQSAETLEEIIQLTPTQRENLIQKGIQNSSRFKKNTILDQIELVYQHIVNLSAVKNYTIDSKKSH